MSNQTLSILPNLNSNIPLIVETNGIYLPHSKLVPDNLISNLKSFLEINMKTMLLLPILMIATLLLSQVTTWTLLLDKLYLLILTLLMVLAPYWSLLVKVKLLMVKKSLRCSKEWFQARTISLTLSKLTLPTLLLQLLTFHYTYKVKIEVLEMVHLLPKKLIPQALTLELLLVFKVHWESCWETKKTNDTTTHLILWLKWKSEWTKQLFLGLQWVTPLSQVETITSTSRKMKIKMISTSLFTLQLLVNLSILMMLLNSTYNLSMITETLKRCMLPCNSTSNLMYLTLLRL